MVLPVGVEPTRPFERHALNVMRTTNFATGALESPITTVTALLWNYPMVCHLPLCIGQSRHFRGSGFLLRCATINPFSPDFVADTGFEPVAPFWSAGVYEAPEIGHFSNPQSSFVDGVRFERTVARQLSGRTR